MLRASRVGLLCRTQLASTSKSGRLLRTSHLRDIRPSSSNGSCSNFKSRNFSSIGSPRPKHAESDSPFRVSHIFTALLLLGVGATVFGLYDFYQTLTKWPPEVRGDLRSGLRAKARKDLKLSQRYLRRAWETVKTLPSDVLSPEPYMKISGVAIALAGVLEADDQPEEAYNIYSEALLLVRPSVKDDIRSFEEGSSKAKSVNDLSIRERKCTVALALKLGEVAEQFNYPAADEEKWLNYAVSEVMRILQDDHSNAGSPAKETKRDDDDSLELPLPSWISLSKTEMATPMERLASFYRRQGEYQHVMTLYQLALQVLLMSESSRPPTIEDQCRAAMVMNNMSETVVHRTNEETIKNETASLEAAARMAQHAIVNSKKFIKRAQSSNTLDEANLCARTFLFATYNLAVINSRLGKQQSRDEDEKRMIEAYDFLGCNFNNEVSDPDVQAVRGAWQEYMRKLDRNKLN